MYKDAIDTAAESSDTELAEELVRSVPIPISISSLNLATTVTVHQAPQDIDELLLSPAAHVT